MKPKEDQQSVEAQNHCRRLILSWFDKHNMVHLEKQYLSDGQKGLELVRGKLKLFLLDGMSGDKFLKDRRKFHYGQWIDGQVQEAIFNPRMTYIGIYGASSDTSAGKSEHWEKLESWKRGVAVAKGRGRITLPSYIEKELVDRIATQGRHGVTWLPKNTEVIPLDRNIFQGSYGVVRRVIICGASFIPEWIEFAGKTMKAKNNLDNRKEHSIEASACHVDHPGVIKI